MPEMPRRSTLYIPDCTIKLYKKHEKLANVFCKYINEI